MGCCCGKTSDDPLLEEFPVAETENGYPPPKPPANRKSDCFHGSEYKQIDADAKKPLATPKSTYESLVGEITHGLTKDMEKLRAIYMWLGNQKIENESYPKITDNSTPRGYMKNIKHSTGSYTGFFTLLCRAAKLPCVIVKGKGKSVSYEVGDQDFKNLNSQWCAVYVQGSWRIVHPLWSFRGVTGFSTGNWTLIEKEGKSENKKEEKSAGQNVRRINEYYFLTDPDEFIYKCRANSDPWQLLAQPWTMDKYINVPYVYPGFFKSGLQFSKDEKVIVKSQKGKSWINFTHSEKIDPEVKYQLFHNEKESKKELPKEKQLDRFVAYNNESGTKEFAIRYPVEGVYKIEYPGLCEFKLICNEVGDFTEEFPKNPENGYGHGFLAKNLGIISAIPSYGFVFLARSQKHKFALTVEDSSKVAATLTGGNNKQDFSQYVTMDVSGNKIDAIVEMPATGDVVDYVLTILVSSRIVLTYLISTDKIESENRSKSPAKEKIEAERDALIKATKGTDVEKLELAIDRFEKKGLEDRGDLTRAKAKLKKLKAEKDADGKKDERIRKRLKLATADNDIDELESAIDEFIGNRLEDNGDLTDAKQRLLELYTSALESATEARQIEKLEYTIDRAKNSRVCGSLKYSQAMLDAEETLKQLKRLKKYLVRILAMKQSTVSEIVSYKRPKPCIHDVMKATYLILGEKEKNLSRWESIQNLSRKLGKESLIRRIKEFDVINLRLPVAGKSERYLDNYDHRTVCTNSAGAGTFYKWSRHIVNEVADEDQRRRSV